ncbi:MAG TPA: cellulase family glycosylhydrolase [Spirochaetota bacterium]|nr:cellulase family glycosylhydrolase [Spirochaetota bacterium]HOL58022.1 cellulase family glycosylhydrolase [Spirochaetota bacterium]HPP05507.1 cellulase family glycosylhydrolase [Spirochaetota bacterium]
MHTKNFVDIPFKNLRLWDAGVFWPDLEKKDNEWDFTKLDKYVEIAEKNGYTLMLTLGQSPEWAASNIYINSPYGGGVKQVAPKSIEIWKRYIRTLGTRYKGKIRYWEIWNEPDVWPFYFGSIQKMVELAKSCYEILKEIDPENKIITPSITGWKGWPGGLAWLDLYLSLGGAKYCDIIGFHFYNGDLTPPEIAFSHIKEIYKILKRHNLLDKPLWNTESGFHLRTKFNQLGAAYVARMHIINLYIGVDKFFWYAMDNHQFGLLYDFNKNQIKESGVAYIETQKWLIGKKIVSLINKEGIYICELNTEEKIVWKERGKKKIKIPEHWNIKKIRFLDGRIEEIKDKYFIITETPVMFSK